jgi:hypothetical protein
LALNLLANALPSSNKQQPDTSIPPPSKRCKTSMTPEPLEEQELGEEEEPLCGIPLQKVLEFENFIVVVFSIWDGLNVECEFFSQAIVVHYSVVEISPSKVATALAMNLDEFFKVAYAQEFQKPVIGSYRVVLPVPIIPELVQKFTVEVTNTPGYQIYKLTKKKQGSTRL